MYENQMAFAISSTMTKTTYAALRDVKPKLDSLFEGGATRWTKTGFRVIKAKKSSFNSGIYAMAGTASYLMDLIHGGRRTSKDGGEGKRSYIPMPVDSGIRTNKFGNFTHKRQENLLKNKDKYFHVSSKNGKSGLYKVTKKGRKVKRKDGKGLKTKGREVRKVIGWVRSRPQKPTRAKRLPLLLIASYRRRFVDIYPETLMKAVSTGRAAPLRIGTGF